MGNNQTNLKIDSYFEEPLKVDPDCKSYEITVHLNPPAQKKDNSRIDRVVLCWRGSRLDVIDTWLSEDHPEKDLSDKRLQWTPKSHMRDFEVMNMFTVKENRIARGQGIGVIIVESLACYAKITYDRSHPYGINMAACMKWDHSDTAKSTLSSDLSLGYDVLLLVKDKPHYLCEKKDKRDENNTPIWIPGLEPLTTYDHGAERGRMSFKSSGFNEKNFIKSFQGIVKLNVGKKGVYPHVVYARTDAGNISINYIAKTDPKDVQIQIMKIWKLPTKDSENVIQMVFGLDRNTEPNQGTPYTRCLPFMYVNKAGDTTIPRTDKSKPSNFKIGVINYDPARIGTEKDPVDDEIDWNNAYWSIHLITEWFVMNQKYSPSHG